MVEVWCNPLGNWGDFAGALQEVPAGDCTGNAFSAAAAAEYRGWRGAACMIL
jgi:hypothetical protein